MIRDGWAVRRARTPVRWLAAIASVCLASHSLAEPPHNGPSPSSDHVVLPARPAVHAIDGAAWLQQGSAATWLRFRSGPEQQRRRDHLVFATDDSRIAMVVDTFRSVSWPREVVRIGARAGGNLRNERNNFPEASILIDNDGSLPRRPDIRYVGIRPFSDDTWHFVAMTWQGHPAGEVRIYLDGELTASHAYDARTDDGRPAAHTLAVAVRPSSWQGERVRSVDGATASLVPITPMALADGGIDMRALHIYRHAADASEILSIMRTTRD